MNLNPSPAWPFPSSVTLGKYFNISGLQPLCLWTNNIFPTQTCLKDATTRSWKWKQFVRCKKAQSEFKYYYLIKWVQHKCIPYLEYNLFSVWNGKSGEDKHLDGWLSLFRGSSGHTTASRCYSPKPCATSTPAHTSKSLGSTWKVSRSHWTLQCVPF